MENVDQSHETNGTKWDQIVHVGKHQYRLRDEAPSGRRERVFAQQWQEANQPPEWLNRGMGLAQILLCADVHGNVTRELTQEEATAMATFAQWLGTNCGFSWLMEALDAAGYKLALKEAARG